MFSCKQSLLRKRRVGVCVAAHNDELYITVLEQLFCGPMVPGVWVVHGAVRPGLSSGRVGGCLCSLDKRDDLQLRMGRYEGQMKAFGREPVSYDPDFDWCHPC